MANLSYSVPEQILEKDYSSTMDSNYFYETSNKRDYKGQPGDPAPNARPRTSNFYSDTLTGRTGYNEEFGWKVVKKEKCGRPGTASGQRKNNPHPKETFMVWKFPNKLPTAEQLKLKEQLMEEICQDKIRSTYQVDYTGLKQGENKTREPTGFNIGMKHVPQHTLNTTVRVDYQKPVYKGNLSGNTTRYGCNETKVISAVGVVPTVIHRSKTQYDTSYTDEFMSKDVGEGNKKIPDLSHYFKNMTVNDKKVIVDMLKTVESKSCERISDWDGPSWKC